MNITILDKVRRTIQKFHMLESDERVVVAVSGGADSVALVHLLNSLRKSLGLWLHLAHLNHMLRKGEADKDALFVQTLAKRLNLPLTCRKTDVKSFAQKSKLSPEEAARQARYEFLLQVAEENSAGKIALGHNRDDQAETVLMRFLRGSGIGGLCGIPAKRKQGACLIIRPLIEIRRSEIIGFLANKNIAFCTDSTNQKNLYFRNRIRNRLMPLLERSFNPNIKEVLINFAENLSDDFNYLQESGKRQLRAARIVSPANRIALDRRKFCALHKAMQKLVSRLAIQQLKGDVRSIDYRHWKELEDLLANRPRNSIVDLPSEISVVKRDKEIVFYKRNAK